MQGDLREMSDIEIGREYWADARKNGDGYCTVCRHCQPGVEPHDTNETCEAEDCGAPAVWGLLALRDAGKITIVD